MSRGPDFEPPLPPAPPPAAPPPVPRAPAKRRHAWGWLAVAAGTALALLVGAALLRYGSPTPTPSPGSELGCDPKATLATPGTDWEEAFTLDPGLGKFGDGNYWSAHALGDCLRLRSQLGQ